MPNVDDHGLEVIKKAARNLEPGTKKDYALQMIMVADESEGGGTSLEPEILNVSAPDANTEIEVSLPLAYKSFVLKSRKVSRLRVAYVANGTSSLWVSVPLGGYWTENKKLTSDKIYIQSDKSDNTIEVVVYK